MEKRSNKKAQIAIFVILAIALIIIIVLLFVFRQNLTFITSGETPIDQVKKCVREATEQGLTLITTQGGAIEPQNFILYQGNKVDYLCYTEEDYQQCIMQKPLLKQTIEQELEAFTQPKINNCLNSLKSSLQDKGYQVSLDQPTTSIEIFPNNIQISLNSLNLQITKDNTESYPTLKTDINSKLYDLVIIAPSISNWEARYGDSEIMNYMLNYPSLKVEKKPQDDGTNIYILTNTKTQDKFLFASRSMVIPVGYTGQ